MEQDYTKILADKMEKDGFTIPGKDLTNPDICKEILASITAVEKGITVEFVDWYCLTTDQLIEVGEKLQNDLLAARKEIARLRDELTHTTATS